MLIENPGSLKACFGKDFAAKYEKPLEYWTRTRPGEMPPDWIKTGWEEDNFLDFVIHLAPTSTEDAEPPEFEDAMCLEWHYRKPDICPKGIRL